MLSRFSSIKLKGKGNAMKKIVSRVKCRGLIQIILTAMLFIFMAFVFPCLVHAAGTISLPQTGQEICYDSTGNTIDCSGTGQDGDIRAGLSWPSPRFANPDGSTPLNPQWGVVLDKLTGLMWTLNANIIKTRDPDFDKNDLDPIYDLLGDGDVPWQKALEYVKQLNNDKYLGYTDWRLPNVNELRSLIDYSQFYTGAPGAGLPPALPQDHPFTNVLDGYWTATASSDLGSPQTYSVQLPYGTTYCFTTFSWDHYYEGVWPVRGGENGAVSLPQTGQTKCFDSQGEIPCGGTGQDGELHTGTAWPNPRFASEVPGTLTDKLTGLMWTQDASHLVLPNGDLPPWQTTLELIAKMNKGEYQNFGYTDWRLPNVNELTSLLNYGVNVTGGSYLWLGSQGFTNLSGWFVPFWTSTSSYADVALAVDIEYRHIQANVPKNYPGVVWPVRTAEEGENKTFKIWIDKDDDGSYDAGKEEVADAPVFVNREKDKRGMTDKNGKITLDKIKDGVKIYAYKELFSVASPKAAASGLGTGVSNPYYTGELKGKMYHFVMASDQMGENGKYFDFPGAGKNLASADLKRDPDGAILIQLVHPRIEWDLVVAYESSHSTYDVDKLKLGMQYAANYIYNYTDGYSTIQNVVIVNLHDSLNNDNEGTPQFDYSDVLMLNKYPAEATVDGIRDASAGAHIFIGKHLYIYKDPAYLWRQIIGFGP